MHFDGVVFPGQGIQHLGMGKDFNEIYPEARDIFSIASDVLQFDLYDICQNNEIKLNSTEYTQPCILTLEIATYEVLKKYYKFAPIFFAGHSLGEYAALVASGVIPFDIAVKIVHFRGKLMQSVVAKDEEGSMAAIIMDPIPLEQINNIAGAFGVDIANDNSKQQVVLSGYKSCVQATIVQLEKIFFDQTMRVVYLLAKSPFHSRYMQKIEPIFHDYLLQFKDQFNTDSLTSVISNYSGGFYPDMQVSTLINHLTKQISGSVKWRENMDNFIKHTKSIVEVGPGSPLRGFFKSIGVNIQSVTNVKTISKVFI